MRTFKDNSGREWSVEINVACVKRVRSMADVDLLDAAGDKLIARLSDDPVLLVDVLYAACYPQAQKDGVSDEQFGQAMGGDALDDAVAALLSELVDFFPKPRRAVLRKAIDKMDQMTQRATDAAIKEIDSPEMDRKFQRAISGILSGDAPESQASTPEVSPSASS